MKWIEEAGPIDPNVYKKLKTRIMKEKLLLIANPLKNYIHDMYLDEKPISDQEINEIEVTYEEVTNKQ